MTQIELPILRNSERSAFKRCQCAWHWAWNEGLVQINEPQNARWFGTCIHLVLAEYYTPPPGKDGFHRGRDMQESWHELTKDAYTTVSSGPHWDEIKEAEFYDACKLGAVMLEGYRKTYGDDGHWEVLMPESRFSANIPYTRDQAKRLFTPSDFSQGVHGVFPAGKHIVKLAGTFDMPVRDHSFPIPRIVVVDHKTTNKREDVKMLVKDDQSGTYISIATSTLRAKGLIKPDEEVQGAIFNYLRKAFPKDDETRDDQGRVRNKPKKEHYEAAFKEINYHVPPRTSLADMATIAQKAGLRVFGDVSKNQGVPLFWRIPVLRSKKSRIRQIQRIAEDAEQMAMIRAGLLPRTKNPGEHCNWCDFNSLCDIDENGDDVEQFKKDVYRVVDMYADHREGARNSKESIAAKQEMGAV